jgi:hypothetical protein
MVRESSRAVMSRPKPMLVPRTRQPETEPRSCGNQPAHESLLTGVFSLCLLPCAPVYYLRSASRRRDPASECLDSEHESRLLKNAAGIADMVWRI